MNYPNLPQKLASKVIIGSDYNKEIYNKLEKLGVEPIFTAKSTNVRQGIQNHADLVYCPLNTDYCLISKEQSELHKKLLSFGYKTEFIDEEPLEQLEDQFME